MCCSQGLASNGSSVCCITVGWNAVAPPAPIPTAMGGPCCPGAGGPAVWPVLPGRATVGMLVLPKGPEPLDRKQGGKWVLDGLNSGLPASPNHWLPDPNAAGQAPPVSRALCGCIHIRSTTRKNDPRISASVGFCCYDLLRSRNEYMRHRQIIQLLAIFSLPCSLIINIII